MSEQDTLLKQIRQQLDDSAEHLNAATQSRLTQIRNRVLDTTVKPGWSWRVPAMALASTAAVAVITISLVWTPASVQPGALEDLPLLTANDAFELIEDVEFYEWLSEEQQNG